MKKIIPIAVIAVSILIIAIFILNRGDDQGLNQQASSIKNINDTSSQTDKYQTQTDDQGKVTIDVTPRTLGIENEKNVFAVSLDTHSVELDFDFTKIIILKDDLNNQYSALEWTGGDSGHHLDGNIVFSKINQQANEVELQISGVDGIDRVFKWTLK